MILFILTGELEGFGGARLARTAAAAMALWAHRCSEVVFPLLLAALVMPPGGGHRWDCPYFQMCFQ